MNSTEQTSVSACRPIGETTLPEYWPQEPPPPPPRAAWIPWPIAILIAPLLWFFPKTLGLHFGRVAWPGVIIGHLLWTIYGIGSVVLAFFAPQTGLPGYVAQAFKAEPPGGSWPVSLSEAVRSPAALLAAAIADRAVRDTEEFLLVMVGTGLAVVAIGVAGAVLLAPWTGGGDKRRCLFMHCAKLTLWSTTSIVLFGLTLQTVALMLPQADTPGMGWTDLEELFWVVGPLWMAYWLWIWLRSGFRYARPPDGPDSAPRRPLCEECGYVLTGMTTTSACPECGASVASSMSYDRHPTSFAAARTRRRRISGYIRTMLRVVFDAKFFKRIQMRDGFAAARRFALWSVAVTGPVAFVIYFILQFALPDHAPVPELISIQFPQALLITWIVLALLVFAVTSLLLQAPLLRAGPFQLQAVVCLYSAAWAVPLAASAALMVHVGFRSFDQFGFAAAWKTTEGIVSLVSLAVVSGLLVAELLILQRRIRHGLRWARFTNA